MAKQDVQKHYAEVARMVQDAHVDEETGFYVVDETRAACSLDRKSEAFEIYDERLVEGIPHAALVASRGCADPVSRANLQPGERVLDLGCGGGVDAIIASRLVGEDGHVYGLDMTPEMIELARSNAQVAGARNIDYLEGAIERIPLPDACVDVVLSNCVINLSDDRHAALAEALRVLAPGGRFVVSDIVELAPVPAEARAALCAITGCTNGMLSVDGYHELLGKIGFCDVVIEKKTVYTTEVLQEKAQRKDRMHHFQALANYDVSARSGSVIIVAHKRLEA